MATTCFVGESANYRAGYDIESKIKSLRAKGLDDQTAELKGVEEFAIECSLIKVGSSKIFKTVLMKGFKFSVYGVLC